MKTVKKDLKLITIDFRGGLDVSDQPAPLGGHNQNSIEETIDDIQLESKAFSNSKPVEEYDWFITVNIGTNQLIRARRFDINKNKVVETSIKWAEYKTDEQYNFWKYCLTKIVNWLLCNDKDTKYDFFFEYTKNEDVHIHGRLKCKFIKCMKDLKVLIHQTLGVPVEQRYLTKIIKYEGLRWNDYANKKDKTYQTTNYPHFVNK